MSAVQQHAITFNGKGSDYFRIWIVNLCLSVLTLGIYSAWAKVRRLQYFYRHTQVDNACLDYHGNPLVILRGRIIAIILFGGYSIFIKTDPYVGLSFLALIMLLTPWLLVRSLRFQLHNTSYRGLRFAFHGQTNKAVGNFLLMPLLSYVSLGLFWPLTRQKITHFLRNNSAFGNCSFGFHGKAGEFYKIYLTSLFLLLGVSLAGGAILSALTLGSKSILSSGSIGMLPAFLIRAGAVLGLIFSVLLLIDYFSTRLQNFIWNHTTLGGIRFVSNQRARELFMISLTNSLLVLATFGIYKPYADIRLARYRIEHLSLLTGSGMDAFMAERQQEVTATGEEIAEMFDIDISF